MRLNNIGTALLLLGVGVAAPSDAEVRARFIPGGAPVARESAISAKVARPTYNLVLPLYVVDNSNSNGVTTLIAVRNASNNAIRAGFRYVSVDRAVILTDNVLLDPRETVTRNLRDFTGLPTTNGSLKTGIVTVTALDPITSSEITAGVLTGDYFYADLSNNFASGDVLVDGSDGFCQNWDTRFFNGGAFSGGTTFTITTLQNSVDGVLRTVAAGDVYTEAGTFVGSVQITSNQIASQVSSTQLGLPAFGTIEWFLPQGTGIVGVTLKAEGRYSVGMPGYCLD